MNDFFGCYFYGYFFYFALGSPSWRG